MTIDDAEVNNFSGGFFNDLKPKVFTVGFNSNSKPPVTLSKKRRHFSKILQKTNFSKNVVGTNLQAKFGVPITFDLGVRLVGIFAHSPV